jgi:phosphatidylserine synthase
VLVVFYLRDDSDAAIWVLMGVQMVCMIFNHVVKPLRYKNVRAHNIELINDWAVLITYYFMLLFTDLISDPKIKYSIAWLLISIQGSAFIASISLALVDIARALKQKYKTRKYCVKETKPDIAVPAT